ncbi:unnamed protein product [Microthlaspi erraticum]|uniref:Uncharacterized protein n=1 Tax=Microthlaspi erraticum TaxID=1685480 RepID=A0A6D2K773_9BRAS|nr:unnamed protein product [Microthlaspi erraticum]
MDSDEELCGDKLENKKRSYDQFSKHWSRRLKPRSSAQDRAHWPTEELSSHDRPAQNMTSVPPSARPSAHTDQGSNCPRSTHPVSRPCAANYHTTRTGRHRLTFVPTAYNDPCATHDHTVRPGRHRPTSGPNLRPISSARRNPTTEQEFPRPRSTRSYRWPLTTRLSAQRPNRLSKRSDRSKADLEVRFTRIEALLLCRLNRPRSSRSSILRAV